MPAHDNENNDFDMKPLLITILIGGIAIVGLKSCTNHKKDNVIIYETVSSTDKLFAPGEHIITMPIDDPLKSPQTYKGYPGYKPIGITAATYGKYSAAYYNGYIMYENVADIRANATDIDADGNYTYNNFGTPIDYEIALYKEDIYDTYQHIVSIPYDMTSSRAQIEYIDGYEVVGIASGAYGPYMGHSAGECILYVNTTPVEYIYDSNNKTYFGKPIEKAKTLEK